MAYNDDQINLYDSDSDSDLPDPEMFEMEVGLFIGCFYII